MSCPSCHRIPLSEIECGCVYYPHSCISKNCLNNHPKLLHSKSNFCSFCLSSPFCEIDVSLYVQSEVLVWEEQSDLYCIHALEQFLIKDLIPIVFQYLRVSKGLSEAFSISVPYRPQEKKWLIPKSWFHAQEKNVRKKLIDLQMFAIEPPSMKLTFNQKIFFLCLK